MGAEENIPDVIQGLEEPESSRIVLTVLGILVLGVLAISTQAFSLFGDSYNTSNRVSCTAEFSLCVSTHSGLISVVTAFTWIWFNEWVVVY